MNADRPLDGIASIRTKIAILVGASILGAVLTYEIGNRSGVTGWVTLPVTLGVALAVSHYLSRGLVQPLRDLTAAAGRMAGGDYTVRTDAAWADETGQLARAFNDMADQLAGHDRQRRELIATVSHELRTPLAAQRALLENLVDGVAPLDTTALGSALAQSERLSALVADLLDLSRLDAGVAALALEPVPVADLLSAAVNEARLTGRPMAYAVSVHPTDLTVEADPARLAQVVVNLLDNAARHSPVDGLVTIDATAREHSWTLTVTDEGPGIAAADASRVLERFGTGTAAGSSSGGTGLGLAIARWVCELHGGSIEVVPTPPGESGGRVRVVLPRHTPAPATAHPSANASAPPDQESAMPAPTPVLPPPATPYAPQAHEEFWPERESGAPVKILAAALGVGALAAFLDPARGGLGFGFWLVLTAGAAVIYLLGVRRRTALVALGGVLTLALVSLVVLRADLGARVLAVLAALMLTAVVVTGARTVSGMAASALAWPASALRGLPLLGRTLSAGRRSPVLWPVVRTVLFTVAGVLIFGALFAGGDALFGSWAGSVLPDLQFDSFTRRTFLFVLAWGFTLTGAYLALNPPRVADLRVPLGRPRARTFEWLVPMASVSALFVVFHIAQATALWGGVDYLLSQTGLTYADYVHQGFGQLTLATALTLGVVALVLRTARQDSVRDRRLVAGAVTVQGVLTLGVVASALYRMSLYQDAYGFTLLRLLVDGFEAWLGLLVLAVIAGTLVPRWRRWVPRFALVTGTLAILAYGAMNPAAWVAGHNIDRYLDGRPIDTQYLRDLGPDAVPTIAERLPGELARCIIDRPGLSLAGGQGLLEWNAGQARANDAAARLPQVADCAPILQPLETTPRF